MQNLNGKAAIITGGSRGIGRAIALRLAQDGARVVICARGLDGLNQVASAITSSGGQALAVAADLRMPEEPARVAEAAVKAYGGIDIVVNNAGATKRGDFLQLVDSNGDNAAVVEDREERDIAQSLLDNLELLKS